MNHKERLWTKDFILLGYSNLFLFLAFEMLMPILPLHMETIGGTSSEIGIVMGIFTVTAILIRLFTGFFADKIGIKSLLVIGGIICLVATGLYDVAMVVVWLIMFRLLHGVGFGIATTLYGTAAADMIPPSRMGEGMGYFGLSNTIAVSIGPFIGVILFEHAGYDIAIVIATAFLVISSFFNIIMKIPRSAPAHKQNTPVEKFVAEPFLSRLVNRQALFPSLLGMLSGFGFGAIISFIALFGKEAGLANIGYFFLVTSIFEVLVRFVSGKIFDAKGPFWVIVPSAFLTCLATVMLSYATNMGTMLGAAAVFGIGFGALFPALQAWIINRVEPNARTSATATFFNLFDIGIAGGAALLGLVAGFVGYGMMYRLSSLFYIALIVVYVASEWKSRQKKRGLNDRQLTL
ncbi:MFS transporter [Cohnella endophytica]|uniref:MFS transporter n=1 Tax=Cohnella endophytica TaxID=2419778 RepID=A0A494Y674_9BACL|nr:MFS transporter [Cohnella endophytica]RKP58170.1 MFS transporter [Cohnella endophytica]